jgi:hypothetical protein
MLLARRGDVERGEALARQAAEAALLSERVDTQADALMSLAEVLLVDGRRSDAAPFVADALRRYEQKEVVSASLRARSLLRELAPNGAREASDGEPFTAASVAPE